MTMPSFASLTAVIATILLIPLSGSCADETGVNRAPGHTENKRTPNGATLLPGGGTTTEAIAQPPKASTSAPGLLEDMLGGVALRIDISKGVRLQGIGSEVVSESGRMFAVLVGKRRIHSDEVD